MQQHTDQQVLFQAVKKGYGHQPAPIIYIKTATIKEISFQFMAEERLKRFAARAAALAWHFEQV